MDKAAMRAWVRANRRARSQAEREVDGALVANALMALPEVAHGIASGRPVAAYLSMSTEPSTAALLGAVRRVGGTVVVPRVNGSTLEWLRFDEGVAVTRSSFGMDEPVGPAVGIGAAAVANCAAVVVPALAVDMRGHRLGQGGGFYDRLVAGFSSGERPPLIAVVYDDEIVGDVPTEPHDLVVDVAVTPQRTLRFHSPAS